MNRERGFEKVSKEEWKKKNRQCKWKNLKLPKRATSRSAGYDFFSPLAFVLMPGEEIKIGLGIKAYMLGDEYLAIYPRSSHGFNYYIRLANSVGVIDSDYYGNSDNDGHIHLKIRNESESEILTVKKGEAICQGIFKEFLLADGDSLLEGTTRSGGMGSTG